MIRMNVKIEITRPTPITTFAVFLYRVVKNRIAPITITIKPSGMPNEKGIIIILSDNLVMTPG